MREVGMQARVVLEHALLAVFGDPGIALIWDTMQWAQVAGSRLEGCSCFVPL